MIRKDYTETNSTNSEYAEDRGYIGFIGYFIITFLMRTIIVFSDLENVLPTEHLRKSTAY